MTPTVREVRSWYNQRYAAHGLDSMRPPAAYPLFLDLLDVQPDARLLDVSCGPGLLLSAARARGVAAVGVDLSEQAVRLAKEAAPPAGVAVGTGERLPFQSGTFDCVTCLGSLEHFLNMAQGVREMLRVAKPGARFCIMVPNQDFIGWKVLGHQGTAQQDINEQLLPLATWRAFFEQNGFHILRVVPDRWHAEKWRHGSARGMLQKAKGLLLEVAWRLIPLAWEYQFIFVLERAPLRNTPATAPRSQAS